MLNEYLLAAALFFAPFETRPQFPGYEETKEEYRERLTSIAADIESETKSRSDAALLLAWAIGESGLAKDTDVGPCYRPSHSKWWTRCDSGHAASMWQIHEHMGKDGTKVTTKMLFADRKLAARTMVRSLRASWKACKHLEPQDRFSQAGIGRCVAGNKSVRARYQLWVKLDGYLKAQAVKAKSTQPDS